MSVTSIQSMEKSFRYWRSNAGYWEATIGMGDTINRGIPSVRSVDSEVSWVDRHYHAIMLASMILELLLLGYIAWKA